MPATYRKRGNTGRSATWSRSGSARSSGTGTTSSRAKYTTLKNNFQQKINSYRTLFSQTQGASSSARPSAATLNSFANWVNKGAVIQTVSAAQVNRWCKTNRKCNTATAAKTVLCSKFGKAPIKAVCKSKTGSFLVATAPIVKGKTFKFPH